MENEKSINDLPIELLWEILLRLPVKSLLLLRCVCKKWLSLISNPNFAKSHFELGLAPTRRCLLFQSLDAFSYDVDALFRDGNTPVKLSLPGKKPPPVNVLRSCRGLVMLDMYLYFIIWNPSTGAHQRISYPHAESRSKVQKVLYGFGYDASKDDYLVVLGWRDKNKGDHFNLFSMRTNSWKNLEVALPNTRISHGLFLNGAFHWLGSPPDDPIIVFDLKEMSFSGIPLPEQVAHSFPSFLMELQGCLALHFWDVPNERKPETWVVMKEYKVQSSWTSYVTVRIGFVPISLSRDGDIIGYDFVANEFSKYNASGQKLKHSSCQPYEYAGHTTYTESLLSLPNYSKGKRKGCQVHQECLEQLDAVTNNNHNEDKENKRVRRPPIWTRDFYCN